MISKLPARIIGDNLEFYIQPEINTNQLFSQNIEGLIFKLTSNSYTDPGKMIFQSQFLSYGKK